jgi:tRNA pseudouridine38-40 synthase
VTTGSLVGPAIPGSGDGGPVRVRIDLAYDGSRFHGWAAQPGRRTVQGELEDALETVLRAPVATTCAGRTDAGVHARGQVVHVDLAHPVDLDRLTARLRGLLGEEIAVTAVGFAPAGFDARFAALWRRYSYRISDARPVDPLRRSDTVAHSRPLDLTAMNEAAAAFLGLHDFAAFCRRRDGATTVRGLLEYRWHRDPDGVAVATVRADAFCHSMVRALVGCLVAVGDGRRPIAWPARVLAAAVRDPAVTVMPAQGLCLEEVRYPADDQLTARAAASRAVRHARPL